jgi:hypothetical protein
MVKITSGGGYNSRVVKHDRKTKQEPVAHKANPAGVADQGMAVQYRKEPLQQGKGYEPKPMGSTGVPGYFNSAQQGPGSGRTIHKSGAQSQYGPVNPGVQNRAPDPPATVPGRDILSDYGKEISGPGRRR